MTTAWMERGTSDMRAPCVSVIAIFLNAERFLAEAIDSVLAQSFGDFETYTAVLQRMGFGSMVAETLKSSAMR